MFFLSPKNDLLFKLLFLQFSDMLPHYGSQYIGWTRGHCHLVHTLRIDVSFNCSVEFSVTLYTSFPNGAQNSKSLRHRNLPTWAPDKLCNELWVNSSSHSTSFCASETLTNSWDIFVVCSRSWIITFKSASQVNNSTKPSRWTQRSKQYCLKFLHIITWITAIYCMISRW